MSAMVVLLATAALLLGLTEERQPMSEGERAEPSQKGKRPRSHRVRSRDAAIVRLSVRVP